MWDSMLKVRAGQIQPTGGPKYLLRTCLRAAFVYIYIKSRREYWISQKALIYKQ